MFVFKIIHLINLVFVNRTVIPMFFNIFKIIYVLINVIGIEDII